MRTACEWFVTRASSCWRAQPGRSMLLLVPQGCDEAASAQLVADWTKDNLVPPPTFANHRPVVVRTSSDSAESSAQFAKTVARRLSSVAGFQLELEPDDSPSDVLRTGVEGALGAGAYPTVIVERFHAFANIRDRGMGSVLATMRDLEHSGAMTTLALSPVGYESIRRSMDSQQPFLNSVYGDNHDQAVMTPLSRDEFVAAATVRGVSTARANQIFSRGGGPDAVYDALLDLADEDDTRMTAVCAQRAGPMIDRFLQRSFSEAGTSLGELLARLAVGRLTEVEVQFLVGNPLAAFVCRKVKGGGLTCSSQIIARRILAGSAAVWQTYDRCLAAYASGDHRTAGEFADMLADESPRLATFRDLVRLRAAISPEPDRGLLGMDWSRTARYARSLLARKADAAQTHGGWIGRMGAWSALVQKAASLAGGRLQLDTLTRLAADADARACLLFMIKSHVDRARSLPQPASRIAQLVNIPEAILQALAAGFCGIDYALPPEQLPAADYDAFFDGQATFVCPPPGTKMTLTSLLVVVPAILSRRPESGAAAFADKGRMRSLQQRLVIRLRNPASHTLAAFDEADAALLTDLCDEWLDAWATLDGLDGASSVVGLADAPTADALADMLYGIDDGAGHSMI